MSTRIELSSRHAIVVTPTKEGDGCILTLENKKGGTLGSTPLTAEERTRLVAALTGGEA